LKYLVQISLKNRKRSAYKLIIKAIHTDGSGDYYDIVIEGHKKVQEMIRHFDFSFQQVCDHLRIMNNRMILLNPVKFIFVKFFLDCSFITKGKQ